MSMLPMTPFERIIKKNQIKRVSREAMEECREILEEVALEVSEHAVRLSKHAGRKTVRKDDIEFALTHK